MLGRFSTDLLCSYETKVAAQVKGALGLTVDVPIVDETLYELHYERTLAQAVLFEDDGVLATGICVPPPELEVPPDDAVLVFAVKPAKVLAFAKGTFGQTRHRFAARA